MKETTMHQTLKLASWLLATALFAMPLASFAQTADEDNSDTDVAEGVAGDVVEHAVGLPTSLQSAVTMGLEKATGAPFSIDSAIGAGAQAAGMSEAAAAVLGSVVGGVSGVTFDSSSIATDLEEGSPYQMEQQARQAQEAAAANQFYQQNIKAQFEREYSQSLRNLKPVPTGPQIESCGVGACK